MCKPSWLLYFFVLSAISCAPRVLSLSALKSVSRPAFVSRTLAEAGPTSTVYRDDAHWKAANAAEADKQLAKKLYEGMTRFEAAETLRSKVYQQLPQESPWTEALPSADVSRALQSLLVTQVDEPSPDYEALGRIGADVAVEFVVERYGLRSHQGRLTSFLEGYGRMFRINGGAELWKRAYVVENTSEGEDALKPEFILRQPQFFRVEMNLLIDAVVEQFTRDLNPGSH